MDDLTRKYAERAGRLKGAIDGLLLSIDGYGLSNMAPGFHRDMLERDFNRAKALLDRFAEEDGKSRDTVSAILDNAKAQRETV